MLIWYHDLLSARAGLPAEMLANGDKAEEARRAGTALGLDELERRVRIVEEMSRAVEQNVNPTLALQVALHRIATPGGDF
jgi:hypothetical protein